MDNQKQTENPSIPFYTHDFEYAQEHNEVDLYRASIRENRKCIEAIQTLIKDNYDGAHLDITPEKWDALTAAHGEERATFILANTIHSVSAWEGRYSRSNKEWAASRFDFGSISPRLEDARLSSHPVLVDGLVSIIRRQKVEKAMLEMETQKGEKESQSVGSLTARSSSVVRPRR